MGKLAKTWDLSEIKNKRFIIIGDIHGCFDQLIELLQKCKYDKEKDIIIATGDLIDRANKPVEVLKFFMPDNPHETHNIYSVLGNHDWKLYRHLIGNKVVVGKALQVTLEEIAIKSAHNIYFKEALALYLQSLPHIIRIPDLMGKPCYIVHAGVNTKLPIDKQSFETCIYIRGIDPKNYLNESDGLWFDTLDGSYYILSGHIKSENVNPVPWNFALDGGCCAGKVLRAMVIENNKYEIVEVDGYKKDMKIPEKFRIIEGKNGEKLITPEFGVGNDSWEDKKTLWYRSLHIGPDDKVISCGFKKFFNIGEGVLHSQVTEKDLLNKKDLIATLKYDGSLLIRFVHNGTIRWRTRGSLEVGLDNKDEILGFIQKYPLLSDPTFCSNLSLLLEWVSPANQIVIKYPEPDIILVGAVWYNKNLPWYDNEFKLLTIKELTDISSLSGIKLVDNFKLNNKNEIIKLIEKLKTEKEIEGYVIRFNNEQDLVKVKSNHYFILHALKSNLNSEALIDLFFSWDRPDFCVFQDQFEKTYDYETWQTIMPAISSMYDGIKIANRILMHIEIFVLEYQNGFSEAKSRKEFALLAKQKYQNEKLSACFSLLDNKPLNKNTYKTWIFQNCKWSSSKEQNNNKRKYKPRIKKIN